MGHWYVLTCSEYCCTQGEELLSSCSAGNEEKVKELLSKNANPDYKNQVNIDLYAHTCYSCMLRAMHACT